MDYLQDGIGLRAMAQRNPLVEYQREGFDMFQAMTEGIKEETVRLVFAAKLTAPAPAPAPDLAAPDGQAPVAAPDVAGKPVPVGVPTQGAALQRTAPQSGEAAETVPSAVGVGGDAAARPDAVRTDAAARTDGAAKTDGAARSADASGDDEPQELPEEDDLAASFALPGLEQKVGGLSYSAPSLDGDSTGSPETRRPAAGAANRAQRRAAAKRDKRPD